MIAELPGGIVEPACAVAGEALTDARITAAVTAAAEPSRNLALIDEGYARTGWRLTPGCRLGASPVACLPARSANAILETPGYGAFDLSISGVCGGPSPSGLGRFELARTFQVEGVFER